MDGTVYLGEKLLPGASELLQWFKEHHIPYLFLTNNSSKNKKEYAQKLARLGLPAEENQIFTSGDATIIFLKKHTPYQRIYLVGTPALEEEFSSHGFTLTDQDPECVVLGFDTTITYAKMVRLCQWLVTGIPYIATHPDINCPTENGFIPDIGSMIEMFAASTGRRPDHIIGKPNRPMVDAIAEKVSIPVEQMAMIGDRLYTDIAMGASGLLTILVLSGETTPSQLASSSIQPDLVAPNLAGVLDWLEQPTP